MWIWNRLYLNDLLIRIWCSHMYKCDCILLTYILNWWWFNNPWTRSLLDRNSVWLKMCAVWFLLLVCSEAAPVVVFWMCLFVFSSGDKDIGRDITVYWRVKVIGRLLYSFLGELSLFFLGAVTKSTPLCNPAARIRRIWKDVFHLLQLLLPFQFRFCYPHCSVRSLFSLLEASQLGMSFYKWTVPVINVLLS